MKVNVKTTSDVLPKLCDDFELLLESKSGSVAKVSIQNTSEFNVYLENGKEATIDWSYMIGAKKEVEFQIENLSRVNLIADWNTSVRVITN